MIRAQSREAVDSEGDHLGLQSLSPEELADFADEYCLRGRTDYSPDNLKQQRLRVKKALEGSMAASESTKKSGKKNT